MLRYNWKQGLRHYPILKRPSRWWRLDYWVGLPQQGFANRTPLNLSTPADNCDCSYAGKDIAAILADEISHTHSEAAYEILDDYLIGLLPTETNRMPPSPPGTPLRGATPRAGSPSPLTGMSSEEELSIPTDISADYKKHKFLDLNRPLLMQVWSGGFSKEFYLQQVHRPRHYKGGESAPIFGNVLEPLSKTPWWVVPMVWLPCICYGVFEAHKGLPNYGVQAAFFSVGLALWTLIEYVLHRCLFHLDEYVLSYNLCDSHFTKDSTNN